MLVTYMSCNYKAPDPNAPKACFTAPKEIFIGIAAAFNSSCPENAVWLKHAIPYIITVNISVTNPTGAKLTIQAGKYIQQ